ncbi:MAG: hypothetical protein GVY19_13095 [Bacteroidetes bacterium]|jgi:hypothetical protein|nr:hypothetical protein [Bacteroidota bacterium]
MSKTDYEAKLASITAIPDDQVKEPHMPVDIYLQESENTYHWAQDDKEKFLSINFDWALVEDLLVRAGACREAQSIWMKESRTREEAERQWKEEAPEAFEFRDQLIRDFRWAFRKRPDLLGNVDAIDEGYTNADMIQDLNDLAVLGKDHPTELEASNFDMAKLDEAAALSDRMATINAKANGERHQDNEEKKIRDKAYTHLKEALDEIRDAGKYLFWNKPDRLKGYTSDYLRRLNTKRGKTDIPDEEPVL